MFQDKFTIDDIEPESGKVRSSISVDCRHLKTFLFSDEGLLLGSRHFDLVSSAWHFISIDVFSVQLVQV